MDQNKCVALLTAIDLGNLTRAAEQLGYTQSGLSYVIKALENEMGFPLLLRSRAGVRPTQDCQRILPLLRELERKNRQLEEEAADIRGLAVGTVSVATFPSISRFWLPQILRDFAQQYPGITVSILETGQEELDECLREGVVDLAFCSYHADTQNQWIPFLEDEIWAVVPQNHPLAGCPELSLAQLADEPFILEDRAYDYDITRVIREAGVHPNVRWTSKDELAILAMVRLELGVSLMPALYLHETHPGVTVLPLTPRAHRQLGASVPDLENLSPAARRFLISAQKTMGVPRDGKAGGAQP